MRKRTDAPDPAEQAPSDGTEQGVEAAPESPTPIPEPLSEPVTTPDPAEETDPYAGIGGTYVTDPATGKRMPTAEWEARRRAPKQSPDSTPPASAPTE